MKTMLAEKKTCLSHGSRFLGSMELLPLLRLILTIYIEKLLFNSGRSGFRKSSSCKHGTCRREKSSNKSSGHRIFLCHLQKRRLPVHHLHTEGTHLRLRRGENSIWQLLLVILWRVIWGNSHIRCTSDEWRHTHGLPIVHHPRSPKARDRGHPPRGAACGLGGHPKPAI